MLRLPSLYLIHLLSRFVLALPEHALPSLDFLRSQQPHPSPSTHGRFAGRQPSEQCRNRQQIGHQIRSFYTRYASSAGTYLTRFWEIHTHGKRHTALPIASPSIDPYQEYLLSVDSSIVRSSLEARARDCLPEFVSIREFNLIDRTNLQSFQNFTASFTARCPSLTRNDTAVNRGLRVPLLLSGHAHLAIVDIHL
jgi:hypothetical protein